jgi:hypothetical protein
MESRRQKYGVMYISCIEYFIIRPKLVDLILREILGLDSDP